MVKVTYKCINRLLRNWKKATDDISGNNKEYLRTLYTGLKALDQSEYKLLYQKFFRDGGVLNNAELGKLYGLTHHQMTREVSSVKVKLQNAINAAGEGSQ